CRGCDRARGEDGAPAGGCRLSSGAAEAVGAAAAPAASQGPAASRETAAEAMPTLSHAEPRG
ncbi:MAG: 30S ribosomal protein S3, partial [Pseudomonadota bacterium]